MENTYKALLLMTPGIGHQKLGRLIEHYGSAQTVWNSGGEQLAESSILTEKEISVLSSFRRARNNPEQIVSSWHRQGIHLCDINDPEYPRLLRNIYDPPQLLFYRGHLYADALYFSIVGSRHATPYGRNVAKSFSQQLARSGVTIVSGAAKGIDAAAHEGALAVGAETVAVLGCGVDIAYPAVNAQLISHIASLGCVVSEYPPGTPPAPGQFPARNRIIAGMSIGVMVVEAAEKSGALITADFALDENRDVFAVPGSVFSRYSFGTHRLIQQGARLVSSAEDLLSELNILAPAKTSKPKDALGVSERKVLEELSYEAPVFIDRLVVDLEMEAAKLMVILLELEMAGYIVKDSAAGYIRVAKE